MIMPDTKTKKPIRENYSVPKPNHERIIIHDSNKNIDPDKYPSNPNPKPKDDR